MNNLGACYHNGLGCERDMDKAIHWYERAADRDSVHALDNLAHCYWEGHGVPEDPKRAAELFRKAHELGHPTAAARLADMGLEIDD